MLMMRIYVVEKCQVCPYNWGSLPLLICYENALQSEKESVSISIADFAMALDMLLGMVFSTGRCMV
jgi:hypothetical protein